MANRFEQVDEAVGDGSRWALEQRPTANGPRSFARVAPTPRCARTGSSSDGAQRSAIGRGESSQTN